MAHNGVALEDFLSWLVALLDDDRRSYTRAEIESELVRFLAESGRSGDPKILFDDWELNLKRARVISSHVIHYSLARETLEVERIPSIEQIAFFVELYGSAIEEVLQRRIADLRPSELEELVELIFGELSWTSGIAKTQQTRDGGMDFTGHFHDPHSGLRLRLFGQVKHTKRSVNASMARDFIGTITTLGNNEPCCGVYVSTGGFSDDALGVFKRSGIKVMTYGTRDLIRMMIDQGIGVKRLHIDGLMINEQLWEEIHKQQD